VAVYYPVDKGYYAANIDDRNTLWARHGDQTLQGIARARGGQSYGGSGRDESLHIIRFLKNVQMDTVYEGEISLDFK
jgi:hypothetical protein